MRFYTPLYCKYLTPSCVQIAYVAKLAMAFLQRLQQKVMHGPIHNCLIVYFCMF